MNATLTIDQLLRAAQLLEQSSTAQQLLGGLHEAQLYKLGQHYQDQHYLQPKLGQLHALETSSLDSTGSSHRSSPSSTSAHSLNGSAPNSPAVQQAQQLQHQQVRGVQSTRQSRAAHNELEKNRRANLRNYLEQLKSVLPPDVETTRDTTLSLLTRARNYIRAMKERQVQLTEAREVLLAENAALQKRLNAVEQVGFAQPAPLPVDSAQPASAPSQETVQVAALTPLDANNDMEVTLEKPEPLALTSPPAYLEFSPCAKPLDTLQSQLNVLQQLQQLNQQLLLQQQQQRQQQQLLFKPAIRATPIDLLNEGLLPQLPLLYPYPYLEQQQQRNAC